MGLILSHLPDLRTDFLTSSRFKPQDIIRVLTPAKEVNFEPPGKPVVIGQVPILMDPSKWGSSLIYPKEVDAGHISELAQQWTEEELKSSYLRNRLLDSFYKQVLTCIPAQQITKLEMAFSDDWFAPGKGEIRNSALHMDREESGYRYSATAAFPGATIFYPQMSAGEYLDMTIEERVSFSRETEYHGQPGDIVFWNDNSMPHRAPRNDKTHAQWQEMLKDTPGIENILKSDGSIRRMFMRVTMQVKEDWVHNVIAASHMKLEMV